MVGESVDCYGKARICISFIRGFKEDAYLSKVLDNGAKLAKLIGALQKIRVPPHLPVYVMFAISCPYPCPTYGQQTIGMVFSLCSISLPYVYLLPIVHCKYGALRCLRDSWLWLTAVSRGLFFQISVLGLSTRTSLDVCASLQV